jgi:uncharacterized protein YcbK (DUF882 family)
VNSWRLIAPAEDWSQPLEIEESVLPVLAEVARRLELRITRDDGQKKLYLGLPQEVPAPAAPVGGTLYPSGKRLSVAQLSEVEATRYSATGSYQAAPLVVAKIEDKLSDHFQAGEFFPHDSSYHYLRVSPELVRRLEQIRRALGNRPVTIHSAYRPPAYNRQVGGVSNSTHIDGLAADISVADISTERLRQVCEQIIGDDGGVGYYPTQLFCHIDVRGSRSRWTG